MYWLLRCQGEYARTFIGTAYMAIAFVIRAITIVLLLLYLDNARTGSFGRWLESPLERRWRRQHQIIGLILVLALVVSFLL